jgi:hypothetical protein
VAQGLSFEFAPTVAKHCDSIAALVVTTQGITGGPHRIPTPTTGQHDNRF